MYSRYAWLGLGLIAAWAWPVSIANAQQSLEERVDALEQQLAESKQDNVATANGSAAITGYDKGFFIKSADGNNFLKVNGMIQMRYTYGNADGLAEDSHNGMDLPRTRLKLSGYTFNPNIFYAMQGDVTRSGTFRIVDALVGYKLNDHVQFRAGQFVHQLKREALIGVAKLSAVEGSLVGSKILPTSISRVQGFEAQYKDEMHRVVLSINEGLASTNTGVGTQNADIGLTGRYEMLVFGNWGKMKDFTAGVGDPSGLVLGIGGHIEEGSNGGVTADAGWQNSVGTSVFGTFLWHDMNDVEAHGAMVHVAQKVTDCFEPFVRFEYGDADTAAEELLLTTVGANYYLYGQSLKITGDFGYAFNSVDGFFSSSSTGWRTDAVGEDGQMVARLQLQFKF